METLGMMMEKDAEESCGPRHSRGEMRCGHRWGHTQGKIDFHGGKVELERPRVRDLAGKELALPSWQQAVAVAGPHSSLDGTTPDKAYFMPLPLRLAA
jgi:hypothetical protein